MDFARKQLEKYGWSDGKGLGKNENGISQPLKPKLKRSMTGVGHNAASDFTEHWWSTLYDKAAGNIQVKEKNGSTKKIKTKDDTGFEITNSTWKLKKKAKLSNVKPQEQYEDFFIRTAVLGSGGSRTERVKKSESDTEDDQAQKDVFKMTDEELFAACEGRTAHKGARHGLKALGKLARIEQQERLLLQQSRFNGYSHASKCTNNRDKEYEEVMEVASLNCEVTMPKKKKKKKHCLKHEDYECESETTNGFSLNNCSIEKGRENLCNLDLQDVRLDESLPRKIKKKKLNSIDKQMHNGKNLENNELDSESDFSNSVKKNKKRKLLDTIDNENCELDVPFCKSNKKKNKNKTGI